MNFTPSLFGPSLAADLELIEAFDPETATEEQSAAYRKAVARRKRAEAPKHGPSRTRWMTTGQQRRQATRDSKREHRKANLRYRRAWMSQTQVLANLRGQIRVADAVVLPELVGLTPLQRNAMNGLKSQFGTYEDPQVVDEDGNAAIFARDEAQTLAAAKDTLAAAVAQRSNG